MKKFLKAIFQVVFWLGILWVTLKLWNKDTPQREAKAVLEANARRANTPPPLLMIDEFTVNSSTSYTEIPIRGRSIQDKGLVCPQPIRVVIAEGKFIKPFRLDVRKCEDSIVYPGESEYPIPSAADIRSSDKLLFMLLERKTWLGFGEPKPDVPADVRIKWE